MSKNVSQFIERHPDYFVRGRHQLGWRAGLHPLIENYARTLAPDQFARTEDRARDLWEAERKRLLREQAALLRDLEALRMQRTSMIRALGSMEGALREETRRLALASVPAVTRRVSRDRRGRVAVPIVLDLVGAVFLYLGLLVESRAAGSYILLGIVSLAVGFLWPHAPLKKLLPDREGRGEPGSSPSVSPHRLRLIKLQHRILKEKHGLLSGRIRTLEHCLEGNHQKLQEPYV